jgi:hypothetical protein
MAENTAKPARGKGRPFEKGTSPNPGGRPRTAAVIREALSGHADEMAQRLLALCRTEYGEDARMAAVVERALEAYFDRIGVSPVPSAAPTASDPAADTQAASVGDEALVEALSRPSVVN